MEPDVTSVEPDPDTVERDPATVERDPATVERDPVTVERDPATVERDPVTVGRDPVIVGRDPATVELAIESCVRVPSTTKAPSSVKVTGRSPLINIDRTRLIYKCCQLIVGLHDNGATAYGFRHVRSVHCFTPVWLYEPKHSSPSL